MLKGKTALVTGSTSGIGLGVAKTLAKQGANIMLNGFGEFESAKIEIEALGVKVSYHGADMSKPEEIADMIRQTTVDFGGLDILVNNAGIQHVASIDEFPPEKWDSIIAINLTSAFHTTRLALPQMKAKNWGRIINIASTHGLVASKGKAAYVAAKHGIVGLTKVAGLETATTGITVNAICPGWVLTPLVQKQIEDKAKQKGIDVDKAKEDLLGEKQPSLQFTTPEQIGDLILFLCSDSGINVRGAAWNIDGGWLAE